MISQQLNDSLQAEKSWGEVSSGLGKVLLGYGVAVFGSMVAAALFYTAVQPLLHTPPRRMTIEHKWFLYGGLAVSLISSLSAWGMIIAGQFRCLMSSSERNGAKWIIFMCMCCVVMSPVLQTLAWMFGTATPVRWHEGPLAVRGARFTLGGLYLMAASGITSFLYLATFWYYLQTVAMCMGALKARIFVFMYLVLTVAMACFTGYWMFGGLHPNRVTEYAPYVSLGWALLSVYWVVMIFVVKVSIDQTISAAYNPMRQPQVAVAS